MSLSDEEARRLATIVTEALINLKYDLQIFKFIGAVIAFLLFVIVWKLAAH